MSKIEIYKCSWGYDLVWYDGKGTYIVYDELKWWQIPWGFVRLWWETRHG